MRSLRLLAVASAVAALSLPAAVLAQTPTAGTPAQVQVQVNGDLVDTLKLNGQFNTFTGGIAATNLTGLLKSNRNLTVFAPTDAAFAAMPAADLAKLMADKTAMQRFILHHVINAPVDSARIKGVKGPIPSGAGDQILLDGSDTAGALKVDGATIIQPDIRTGSGLLHVVDRVLIGGQGAVDPPAEAPAAPAA